jgi:hypothetical protein
MEERTGDLKGKKAFRSRYGEHCRTMHPVSSYVKKKKNMLC